MPKKKRGITAIQEDSQSQENQNQESLKEQVLGMYYGPSYYDDLQKKGYFNEKRAKEALGANTFLSTFNVLDESNYYDVDKGIKQDAKINQKIYSHYKNEYKKFVSSSQVKIQSAENNKNIKYRYREEEYNNIPLIEDVYAEEKKISWFRKIINKIRGKKNEKEDVLVELPMYDSDGNKSDKFSIIIGRDKEGNRIISAPADIVIDKDTKMSDPVKIRRDGNDYFMPISYTGYQIFHNEMIFGKEYNAKSCFRAVNDKIKSNEALNTTQKTEEMMSGIGYTVPGMGRYNENDNQNDKKINVQRLKEQRKNNQSQQGGRK